MADIIVRSSFATLRISQELHLTAEGFTGQEGARTLGDLAPVMMDRPNLPNETVLYRMFRSFVRPSDAGVFKSKNLRHDITIMASVNLGVEPNKTLGHYHPEAAGGLTYPEVYHVLHGQATYLLQREGPDGVEDFVIVEARRGDALIIPPNYGHVTVNTGKTPLVMANLVSDRFASIYRGFMEKGGAAYHLLRDGTLLANSRYGRLPKPRQARPNFKVSKDLYEDFLSCPGCFAYLNNPIRLGGLGKI